METKQKLLIIFNQIIDNKNSKIKIDQLDESLDLRNDLGFDSLDLAELTVRIEEDFDVDVFADGLINTVGELLAKIK